MYTSPEITAKLAELTDWQPDVGDNFSSDFLLSKLQLRHRGVRYNDDYHQWEAFGDIPNPKPGEPSSAAYSGNSPANALGELHVWLLENDAQKPKA